MKTITKSVDTSWLKLFVELAIKNQPALLDSSFTESWECRKEWTTGEGPDNERLLSKYGEATVPTVNSTTGECRDFTFREYIKYIDEVEGGGEDVFYLKDWHFQKEFGCFMYDLPLFLESDWINREAWTDDSDNALRGDYMFMYYGAEGTWTPFHSDVLSSHSWSANICGEKLWYFVPRGNEELFREGKDFIKDLRSRKDLWEQAGVITIIQHEGEIMFVPSNWYHQVHNLKRTISLNHNSINASNIFLVLDFLQRRELDVREELKDCVDTFSEEEMAEQVQTVLGADACQSPASICMRILCGTLFLTKFFTAGPLFLRKP